MASESETVEEIAKRVRRDCSAYPLPTAAAEMLKLVREVEAAHRREVDELNFKLMTAKSEQKTAANVIIEQTNKVEKLDSEVAELHGALRQAYRALYSISCARYGKGLTLTDSMHELVEIARECSDGLYDNEKLRKALEGEK